MRNLLSANQDLIVEELFKIIRKYELREELSLAVEQ